MHEPLAIGPAISSPADVCCVSFLHHVGAFKYIIHALKELRR